MSNPVPRKTSILCYSDSGVGKTTQFRYLAEYVWNRFQLKSRFICLDGGSLWGCVEDFVEQGFVEPLQVPVTPEFNPFSTMKKLGRGMWPKDGIIHQPAAIAPTKQGEAIRYKTNTEWLPLTPEIAAKIGLIGTDSLTGYSSALMYDQAATNIRRGGEAGTVREEEGEQMGSNTQGHYGDTQNEVKNYVNAIVALPIPYAYFTALADGGTENTSGVKRPVFGPQIAGSAATGEMPKLVTNCFHLTAEGLGTARVVKAFYEDHPDPALPPNMKWKAKSSSLLPMQKMEFAKKFPQGFFPLSPERGIRDFLDFRDMADEALRAKK